MRQNSIKKINPLAPTKISSESNQTGWFVTWEFIRIIMVLTPTHNLVIPSQSC